MASWNPWTRISSRSSGSPSSSTSIRLPDLDLLDAGDADRLGDLGAVPDLRVEQAELAQHERGEHLAFPRVQAVRLHLVAQGGPRRREVDPGLPGPVPCCLEDLVVRRERRRSSRRRRRRRVLVRASGLRPQSAESRACGAIVRGDLKLLGESAAANPRSIRRGRLQEARVRTTGPSAFAGTGAFPAARPSTSRGSCFGS
jgi:hypothetical protein